MRIQNLRPAIIRAGLLTLALAVNACGPLHLGGGNRATVIFTNETLDQATVYASASGIDPIRIGTVLGNHTDTLSVPTSVTDRGSTTTISVRMLPSSTRPTSGPISLRPGESVRVRLPAGAGTLLVTPGG